MNKVAIITGSTRGIGRFLALSLAKNNYNITITGKSTKSTEKLPGDIFTVSEEVKKNGSDALPFQLDVRNEDQIKDCVESTYNKWGRIDLLINNAGALWWKPISDTPAKRYDIINEVNSRGSYLMARESIPYMIKNDGGHIINFSPPIEPVINTDYLPLKNKTAYMISKLGMTLGAMGIAKEYEGQNIAANTLWPITPVESYALINNKLGNKKTWRKPDIIADCILEILKEDKNTFTGKQILDELYLRSKGITDFTKYRCHPDHEPPRLDEIHQLWDAGKKN